MNCTVPGHLIEAGVAFFGRPVNAALLEVVCRLADHIDRVLSPDDNQLHGYPGHPEIELALMRLYDVTGNHAIWRWLLLR